MSNLTKLKHPYGYVANTIINDKTLSYNAKGVYLYILSKPDQWDFSHKRIANDSITSEYSVRKAVKELEESNLLKRTKLKNGRVVYEIKDPVQECVIQKTNTTSGNKSQKMNTQVANLQVAKTGGISNKDKEVIKSISNKDSATSLRVESLINSFKDVNPIYKSWFSNKTQRKACEELLELMDYEKLLSLIGKVLPITNKRQYAPTITTPHQLHQKFAQLESYLLKEKEKNNNQFKVLC